MQRTDKSWSANIIELRISNGCKSFSRKPIFEALSSMCGISIIYAKLNKLQNQLSTETVDKPGLDRF